MNTCVGVDYYSPILRLANNFTGRWLILELLQFENYEELACDITDTLDALEDEFSDVSVIAKYDEAREIIKELLCLGYDIASIDIHREEFEEYWDEYIIGLNFEGVWCEKFKRDTGYFTDESAVIYIMDNCSSNVIPYCKSENLYEVSVGDSEAEEFKEYSYIINGEPVDKETFDEYIARYKENNHDENADLRHSMTINVNLDTDEAEKIICDIEKNMRRKLFCMVDFLYGYPMRFFC